MLAEKKHSNIKLRKKFRTITSLLLTLTTVTSTSVASFAAAPAQIPTCDEAYYATLDYYGAIKDSSVVKSYTMNGATRISDFGVYDEVSNLTDSTEASTADGNVVFDFGDNAPDHFYFEGKTAEPFARLPWSIDISYKLNGVPSKAEDLSGKQGLVEIDIDILPNDGASEYCKNNFVLTGIAAFNADKILSLDAPGAQVQLIGNIKAALFMVLPGEEQHYTISVGSDEFSFSGMTFMEVPATLTQLSKVAELRETKEKIEDSYNQISNSMDEILDTLNGMGASLNLTADGIDELNSARAEINAGKSEIYNNIDTTVADISNISSAIEPFKSHISTASSAVTEMTGTLTELTATSTSLKGTLSKVRKDINSLKSDMADLRTMSTDIDKHLPALKKALNNLGNDFDDLGNDMDSLKSSASSFQTLLSKLKGIAPVEEISYQGMTISEIKENVTSVKDLHSKYEQAVAAGIFAGSFSDFLNYLVSVGQVDQDTANNALYLWDQIENNDLEKTLSQAETANTLINGVNQRIDEANAFIKEASVPTSKLLNNLSSLCATLGEDGLSGDLDSLSSSAYEIVDILDKNDSTLTSIIDNVNSMGTTLEEATTVADTALDQMASLDDTINKYEPSVQQALTDSNALISRLQDTTKNAETLIKSVTSLSKSTGTLLNSGTEKTFTGLAEALRRSADGLSKTTNIKNAKNSITDAIDKEWDNYSGQVNNLLLIDPDAEIVSMTSSQNAAPSSIQFVMRTEEIKVTPPEADDDVAEKTKEDTSLFKKIVNMFKGIGDAVTGAF